MTLNNGNVVGSVGVRPFVATIRKSAELHMSNVTRYLAAAAHSDASFRREVLKDIHYAPFRCKAPEFGVDANLVTDQCLIAERRRKIRDALLFVALLIFLIPSGALSDINYVLEDSNNLYLYLMYHSTSLVLLILTSAVILFGEKLIVHHFTLRRQFAKRSAMSATRPPGAPHQNLIVYAGYAPFVGSGLALRDWSFAVDLRKAKEGDEGQAEAVSVEGVLQAVRSRIGELAIPNLEQYNALFVDGRRVREDRQLMPSPYDLPPSLISEEMITSFGSGEEDRRRSYFCVAITDWSGELIMTSYLRSKKGKSHLFIELSHFILPPLKEKYYNIDSTDPMLRVKWIIEHALGAIITSPFLLILSPLSVLASVLAPIQRWFASRRVRKTIAQNPVFNFGATTSVRQLGSENRFRIYFQQLDRDMHLKTIEICIIDAIVAYLDELGIDTSDIRERRTAILNTGVMITGGTVNSESVVAGAGAKSVISRIQSGLNVGGDRAHPSTSGATTSGGGAA
jgi:hypothetical protein